MTGRGRRLPYGTRTEVCATVFAELNIICTGVGSQRQTHRFTVHSFQLPMPPIEIRPRLIPARAPGATAPSTRPHAYHPQMALEKPAKLSAAMAPWPATKPRVTALAGTPPAMRPAEVRHLGRVRVRPRARARARARAGVRARARGSRGAQERVDHGAYCGYTYYGDTHRRELITVAPSRSDLVEALVSAKAIRAV